MIAELWRHPVKSMGGERLGAADLDAGDRTYALVDRDTGRVASSAGDARRWGQLLRCRAHHEPTGPGRAVGRVRLSDATVVDVDAPDVDARLSDVLGRAVHLRHGRPHTDVAPVHLLTTSTLERLAELEPASRFDARRFRPNLVVGTEAPGFVEQDWIGRDLRIGGAVRLRVLDHCPRCVATVLPQADLPHDRAVLRVAARHNDGNVGVYAQVVQAGRVRVGDPVEVAP